MQVREVGQEILIDEDGEQNEVVDKALEVVVERRRGFDAPKIEILTHEREVEQVEVDRLEAEKNGCVQDGTASQGEKYYTPPIPLFLLQ